MGAWIEIEGNTCRFDILSMSLPSWERGLKSLYFGVGFKEMYVAPLVGAWIEILFGMSKDYTVESRSPRGSVD